MAWLPRRRNLPLANHPVALTHDVKSAQRAVALALRPHRIIPRGGSRRPEIRFHHVRLNHVTLSYLHYSDPVTVEIGGLPELYFVQLPLTGKLKAHIGPHHVTASPRYGLVLGPPHPITLEISGGCAQIFVGLPRVLLENVAVGRALPLEFAPSIRLDHPPWRQWTKLIALLIDDIEADHHVFDRTPVLAVAESLVASAFLAAATPEYHVEGLETAPLPHFVKRAVDYLRANLNESISIAELLRISGVSRATLFRGFHTFIGASPAVFHRRLRLEAAHAELAETSSHRISVADVAARHGFSSAGRFAALYREVFGERPSVTLRKERHSR